MTSESVLLSLLMLSLREVEARSNWAACPRLWKAWGRTMELTQINQIFARCLPTRLLSAFGSTATPEAGQDVCNRSGFKSIFGISKILGSASVIFIYPCMSRGLSETAILLFIYITLTIDFFFLNNLRQPAEYIFNFLCKAWSCFLLFTDSWISYCLQQINAQILVCALKIEV